MADKRLKRLVMDADDYVIFEECLLLEHPVSLIPDPDSTEEDPLPDIPEFTNEEWVMYLAFRYLGREANAGAIKKRMVDDPIDREIMKRAIKKTFDR